MKHQTIGYKRVSTPEQNPERQLEAVQLDKVFIDTVSGKNRKRPQLDAMLEYAREGDTIIVHSMDRLARNLDDLRQIVNEVVGQGINIAFQKESLTFDGKDSSYSRLMLSMMGAFSEFERSLILERQREGISLAKARGVYKGGTRKLSSDDIKEIKRKRAKGEGVTSLACQYSVSRGTIYKYW